MQGYLEQGIQTAVAQGRSTKIILMIMWTRTSRLSKKISLSFPGTPKQTSLLPQVLLARQEFRAHHIQSEVPPPHEIVPSGSLLHSETVNLDMQLFCHLPSHWIRAAIVAVNGRWHRIVPMHKCTVRCAFTKAQKNPVHHPRPILGTHCLRSSPGKHTPLSKATLRTQVSRDNKVPHRPRGGLTRSQRLHSQKAVAAWVTFSSSPSALRHATKESARVPFSRL